MTTSRSAAAASYGRPAFWKVPGSGYESPPPRQSYSRAPPLPPPILPPPGRRRSSSGLKKRVRFADEANVGVQVGSPSYGELLRGDIIAKIGEYDARDLSHADAQQLFRGAGNDIRLVVHRDNKIAYTQGVSQDAGPGSRSNSTLPPASPDLLPHRGPSPFLPGPSHFERALQLPVDTLPQTVFPQLNASGGYEIPSSVFSPKPTRDHQQDVEEEQAAIVNQPYRTTPLVLPGAKVKKDAPTTESYLRHYPNPAVRAHPGHDYHDSIMKQRVADTMLHKVVGSEADTGRVFHKQFNSPIGLYSNSNIEDTIRTTVPFATSESNRLKDSPLHRPLPTKLNGIFIDLSFLEQKRIILEQQKQKDQLAEQQRQHRQQKLQQLYQQNK
ncbi:uncharacterized protein Dana_GF24342, isoform G [Drosophila ananassae]|uniref:Uncharacterized protein, isoform G n=1 Tax=Drosophila ananassae TaxID=7217 RepID=A0A0P8ZUC7_DROAN|nr:uncharacterized protein LOC6506975 isoform X4 [Drosophila ananassae]KPU78161.1 uncharacterized protein Dana_GF24342, isoform G [Drosophila ananassae]